ncbi:unnamed protein product, partial [Cyprideis torosa]
KNEQDSDKATAPTGGLFARLKSGLSKTSNTLTAGLVGRKKIDDELLEDLETQLLMADVGVDATDRIIRQLTARVKRNELADGDALYHALAELMTDSLSRSDVPLIIPESDDPFVILVVGINGAGKTTSIGKLAKHLQTAGYSVMLAAGDTFRAAAVEQLQTWGERNHVPVISQGSGADSASVIFDALQSAKARNIDVLIADTAGRLHTQDHLMSELQKVKRVMGKLDANAPHETLLVVDGGTGQNALKQAEAFHASMNLTGLAVTKLDGTAKARYARRMITLKHLGKSYAGGHDALLDINLHIGRGELTFLTGHSGAGKSSLLRMLALIDRPTRGSMKVNGHEISRLPNSAIPAYRRSLGIIFQDHRLLSDRTIFDNIALPLQISGQPQELIQRRVRASLDKVGLLSKENEFPAALSSGQQQRIGIARAIINKPAILLADEPTGNLDPDLSREIMNLFVQFNQVGVTVLIASHDHHLIESFDHRIIELSNGQIVGEH